MYVQAQVASMHKIHTSIYSLSLTSGQVYAPNQPQSFCQALPTGMLHTCTHESGLDLDVSLPVIPHIPTGNIQTVMSGLDHPRPSVPRGTSPVLAETAEDAIRGAQQLTSTTIQKMANAGGYTLGGEVKKCMNCGTTSSPKWRGNGGELCNACVLRVTKRVRTSYGALKAQVARLICNGNL